MGRGQRITIGTATVILTFCLFAKGRNLGVTQMGTPKTRVVASCDGFPRELFSVSETGDGSLIIPIRAETRGAPDSLFGLQAWQTYRVSIHPSSKGEIAGTTIKSTMITEIGRKLENSQFIHGEKENLLTIAFAKLCPILDNRYSFNFRKRDKIVHTQSFFTFDRTTLIYIVVISQRGKAAPYPIKGFSLHYCDFSIFRLNIYTTLSNIPATHVGGWLEQPTNAPRIDGKIEDSSKIRTAYSFNNSEVEILLLEICQFITAESINTFAKEEPEAIYLLDVPVWFHENVETLRISRIARGGV